LASGPLDVAIIVLNWRNLADTRECCASLQRLHYRNLRVYVVDNGSGDGSGEALASEFPQFRHIRNATNLGFTGGNNEAVKVALQEGADYILLLNNDTEVDPDFLKHMVDAAERDPQIGIVGARTYFHSTPTIVWYGGATIDFNQWMPIKHIGEGDADSDWYAGGRETGFVTGCSLLVKAAVLKEIGLLCPSFGYYCEDVDLCLRAKRAGWKLWYEGKSRVWHKVNRSTSQLRVDLTYYDYRNQIAVCRRHALLTTLTKMVAKAFARTLLSPYDSPRETAIRLQGIWHGMVGRGGMAPNKLGGGLWTLLANLGRKARQLREALRLQPNPNSARIK
jgi:GT2 family glycosyltransferase